MSLHEIKSQQIHVQKSALITIENKLKLFLLVSSGPDEVRSDLNPTLTTNLSPIMNTKQTDKKDKH